MSASAPLLERDKSVEIAQWVKSVVYKQDRLTKSFDWMFMASFVAHVIAGATHHHSGISDMLAPDGKTLTLVGWRGSSMVSEYRAIQRSKNKHKRQRLLTWKASCVAMTLIGLIGAMGLKWWPTQSSTLLGLMGAAKIGAVAPLVLAPLVGFMAWRLNQKARIAKQKCEPLGLLENRLDKYESLIALEAGFRQSYLEQGLVNKYDHDIQRLRHEIDALSQRVEMSPNQIERVNQCVGETRMPLDRANKISGALLSKQQHKASALKLNARSLALVATGLLLTGVAVFCPPAAVVLGGVAAFCMGVVSAMRGVHLFHSFRSGRAKREVFKAITANLAFTDENILGLLEGSRSPDKSTRKQAEKDLEQYVSDAIVRKELDLPADAVVRQYISKNGIRDIMRVYCNKHHSAAKCFNKAAAKYGFDQSPEILTQKNVSESELALISGFQRELNSLNTFSAPDCENAVAGEQRAVIAPSSPRPSDSLSFIGGVPPARREVHDPIGYNH